MAKLYVTLAFMVRSLIFYSKFLFQAADSYTIVDWTLCTNVRI